MDNNKKWGTIKLKKLNDDIQNIKRMKQCRYLFADEPLVFLPSQQEEDQEPYYTAFKNIDPVIVNTINLNKFIRNIETKHYRLPELLKTQKYVMPRMGSGSYS